MASPKSPKFTTISLTAVNGESKLKVKQASPNKSPKKRVVVDQYLNRSSLEPVCDQSNGDLHLKDKPEMNKQVKASRRLEMNDTHGISVPQKSRKRPVPRILCDVCKIYCNSKIAMEQHLVGRRHRIFSLKKEFDKLKANRNGILITSPNASPLDADTISVEYKTSCKKKDVKFNIKNCSDSEVIFDRCEIVDLAHATRRSFRDFCWPEKPEKETVPPNGELRASLSCRKRAVGCYCTKVAFIFSNPSMAIVRDIEVQIMTDLMKDLGPKSPYKHPPRVSVKLGKVETIDGLRPEWDGSKDMLDRDVVLENYYIPSSLRKALNHGLQDVENSEQKDTACDFMDRLVKPLSQKNYCDHFSLLLHIEEAQMEVDIRKYDMAEVTLGACKENRTLLSLEVPGLSEKRPSVLVGDHLFLRLLKNDKTPEGTEYKAYVHRTCLNKVELGLSARLRDTWIQKMKFNCRFNFNRLSLRLQHRAVQFAEENSLYGFLFPSKENICTIGCIQPVDTPLIFFNKQVENNEQQALAVRHIVAGSSRPAPFLIFGPPGTGKTVTMVEAMKQVLKCVPSSRILACAPSNNAADLLTEKLLDHLVVPKKSILRMNAVSRDWSQVPQKIKDCCNYDHGWYFPPSSDVKQMKVVVTTLVTAGRLVSANFPPGHFTHIFIDEAGQSVEPEAIIPIAGIFESAVAARDGGQVVLAGDPEQLGPVIRSPIAIKYGLAVSMLERFMKNVEVYQRNEDSKNATEAYDQRLLVKLVRNYRSHPDILQVPNESFYQNELEIYADEVVRESFCQWSELPRKGFPLIFHGVIGKDEREERSPSFFNTAEIEVVVDYVNKLLEIKQSRIQPKEIGIISPYRKQVQKLRQVLKTEKHNDISIGTVEEFQGQERKVILISTVRSSTNFLSLDYECKLGFLRNPKRFNVAVTRAKALLIVVGNPHILCRDEHWNKLLKYCIEKDAYVGCEFNSPTEDSDEELEECLENLNNLSLSELEKDKRQGMDISQLAHAVDPEWRQDH